MAERILLRKTLSGLEAVDAQGGEALDGIALGEDVSAQITRPRNPGFHRKAFSLFKFAFDNWNPDAGEAMEWNGVRVRKNFERFRKDLIIMAGYYRPVFNARGEVRAEPESLSWASMSQERFERVYSDVVDVVLERIIDTRAMNDGEVQRLQNQLLAYVG